MLLRICGLQNIVKIFIYRRDAREFVDAIYSIVNKAFLFLLGGYYGGCVGGNIFLAARSQDKRSRTRQF